jgi:hypothetical protein
MLNVLEEFELSVSSFTENWGAEWLHDLLYRNRGTGELVFSRTRAVVRVEKCKMNGVGVPNESKGAC